MGILDTIGGALGTLTGSFNRGQNEFRSVDPYGHLAGQAGAAGAFADVGQQGFQQARGQLQGVAGQLRRQMTGQDSLSGEQLRQGLAQNLAAQRSMAAAARPENAAMAARTAAMNAGRLGAGLAGQQAMAGIAERQAAAQNLGSLLGNIRQQDLQAALGGRGQALQGYGAIEQARGQRFNALTQTPTQGEQLLGAGLGLAQLGALSDRRQKRDIKKAGKDAERFLDGLKPYRFRYTDERHGKGEQLGIMAQDLEATPLGKQAVVDTSAGKVVHGAKLATALAAATSQLHKRMKRLERHKLPKAQVVRRKKK